MEQIFRQMRKSENGFTLVELMWVVAFTFLVISTAYLVYEAGFRSYTNTSSWSEAQDEARRAGRIVVRYLRQAKSISAAAAGDNRLGFYAQLSETGTASYILLDLQGTELVMTIDGGARQTFRLVRNISQSQPMFTYLDRNGEKISDPARRASDTRSIRITVITDAKPQSDPPPYQLSTLVDLRNFVN